MAVYYYDVGGCQRQAQAKRFSAGGRRRQGTRMTEKTMSTGLRLLLSGLIVLPAFLLGCLPPPGSPPPPGNTNAPDNPAAQFDEVLRSLLNEPPTADAGEDQTVAPGGTVQLSATHSSDPDGDRLRYFWQQVGDDTIDLDQPFSSIVVFTAPTDVTSAVTLTFEVVVSDGFAAVRDEVRITVAP